MSRALYIPDFEWLLSSAEDGARTSAETTFVEDMRAKYDEYDQECFVSERQEAWLRALAERN